MRINRSVALLILLVLTSGLAASDLNTALMQSTCKITGVGTIGTGFIMAKVDPRNPQRAFYTLITADHVLRASKSDTVVLLLRQRRNDDTWKRVEFPIQIRDKRGILWKKHPDVDVAAMFVNLPKDMAITVVSTADLIEDDKLQEWEIHPGFELSCLGYPFGAEANPDGFPILRSGRIASYPLIPTKQTKAFLFDFNVYRGNSGGPVYFFERNPTFDGSFRMGTTIYGIIGIVVRERNIMEQVRSQYQKEERIIPLQLGEVVHASFIKELVDSMGNPDIK